MVQHSDSVSEIIFRQRHVAMYSMLCLNFVFSCKDYSIAR